jgi:hypothetical protein
MLAAVPVLLAGLLPLDPDLAARWTWAGAWYYPVGDSFALGSTVPGTRGFEVTRNVMDGGHQGADLSIRRGGDPVRAAANGIVVLAGTGEDPGGFGVHVVIAHRDGDGRLVYSVYAHLEHGSVHVKPGDPVTAGQPIGRVGSTGRATSPHLHFEVRIPDDPSLRWEKAQVVDPVAFVVAHLPETRADTTWARPYRLWAEAAGIALAGVRPDDRPVEGEWWCALAASLALEDSALADSPDAARERMTAAGIKLRTTDASQLLEWDDLLADLDRVPERMWRLPVCPVTKDSQERTHRDRIPKESKGGDALRHAPPTRADVCLLLAGCAEEPPKP